MKQRPLPQLHNMNDFTELEGELKKLRPLRPSSGLVVRVELALADAGKIADRIVTPHRFRVNWIALSVSVAAAAGILILARVDYHPAAARQMASAAPVLEPSAARSPSYQAQGLTRVVYNQSDEGLIFPRGGEEPVRRIRTMKRETLHWQDRRSGAQLQVSYPTEEVRLIPVSGQ
jgi:hypothetical protein